MITREHRQEDLSCAYISAVAAKAGYNCGRPGGHDYGVDLEISSVEEIGGIRDPSHYLHIQAKATQNFTSSERDIRYDLDVKAYNMLCRKDRGTPLILVLYCMPKIEDEWLLVQEHSTTPKYCGYWKSLRGQAQSKNIETVRINIPKDNTFSDQSLRSIMTTIEGGGRLP